MVDQPTVPVIDLTTASGEDLVAGLQSTSCVLLTGLGDIPRLAEAVIATSDDFFRRPVDEKELVQWDGTGQWSGWQPVYAAGDQARALERFEIALPNPATFDDRDDWAASFGGWPAEPAAMPATWATYYAALWALSERIVVMMADALDLPRADLPAWTAQQHSNLCANHYITQDTPPPSGQMRQTPHTDIGGLTLLWTDGRPGLEAQIGPDGSWLPLIVPPDTLLLQAGDLLHRWSRRTIPANNHRVVNPPRGEGITQTDRYSLVYFHHPDLDSWIPAAEDGAPASNAREHVMSRQSAAYALT